MKAFKIILGQQEFEPEAKPNKFHQLLVHTARINNESKEISKDMSLFETFRGEQILQKSKMDRIPRDCDQSNGTELE